MEPKKTEKADLTNKSFLFLSIGLVISLLLAITAFSYRVYDDTSVKDLGNKDAVQEEILEVIVFQQPHSISKLILDSFRQAICGINAGTPH